MITFASALLLLTFLQEDPRPTALSSSPVTEMPAQVTDAIYTHPSKNPEGCTHCRVRPQVLLSSYKDAYFVTGFDSKTQVKFQFSFRFNLLPTGSEHSAFFGYTQKSFMDAWSASSPFKESNYNPEVFYGYFRDPQETLCQCEVKLRLWAFRSGIEHESNGLGDEDGNSRSWNRLYVTSMWGVRGDILSFNVSPKVWLPFAISNENKDITDYVSYGNVTAELGAWEKARIGVTVMGWDRISVQSWIVYRPWYDTASAWRLAPSLYVQSYYGYAESLIALKTKVNTVRVGVSFNDQFFRVETSQ